MSIISVDMRTNPCKENSNILFYICIPVYKVEKYISECIESVLKQTYQNFKMILVDDGSPDCSGEICDRFALMDERIKVIHQENMGLMAARQSAIQYVKQQLYNQKNTFIVYLDSDDTLKENALERIATMINKYNCDVVVYGLERVTEGKIIIPYDTSKGIQGMITNKRELYNLVFNDFQYNPLCRKAVSVNLISDINYRNYYHILHGEDLLQSIIYYKNCKKCYFLNEGLYNYTINPDSITHSISGNNYKIDFTVRQKVYEFLLSENVFTEKDWEQYNSYCIDIIISKIRIIMSFPIENRKKKEFLLQIAESNYYKQYIQGKPFDARTAGLKMVLYKLFEHHVYW